MPLLTATGYTMTDKNVWFVTGAGRGMGVDTGKATLGSPKEEKERSSDEVEHEYATKGYWLAKYPVTQSEWKAVMGDNPSFFDGKKDNKAKGIDTSRFPVESVSWDDCQKFL